jgi:hypothetical protein
LGENVQAWDYQTPVLLDRPLEQLIVKVHQHIEKLGEYRTALVSAAVTGKIDYGPKCRFNVGRLV